MSDYTILMACRHWPDIAERAIRSIRQLSDAPIVLIDDASPNPRSKAGFCALRTQFNLPGCRSEIHLQHGLALDWALAYSQTRWVITCDHDIIINKKAAFDILFGRDLAGVGAVGRASNNDTCVIFGHYIHPAWALWDAEVIRRHNLSFAPFKLPTKKVPMVFATGQFLSYRLAGLGDAFWEAKDEPRRLVPVDFGDAITHDQAWRTRGDTWRDRVRLE